MSDKEQAEKFFQSCRLLANQDPPRDPRINRVWPRTSIEEVVLGRMFARVAVLPRHGLHEVTLFVNCSRRAANRFRAETSNNTLFLSGPIPLARHPRRRTRRGKHANDKAPQGILVGGQCVQLNRCIDVTLMVPSDLPIMISNMVGAVGIGAGLLAVDLWTVQPVHLYAPRVDCVTGVFGGGGVATFDEVTSSSTDVKAIPGSKIVLKRPAQA